jgi:hypothetical protein
MDVDAVTFQFVGKRLFDVERHSIKARMFVPQAVQHFVHVRRVCHRAIEICGQPVDLFLHGKCANPQEALVIPIGIVAAQFDLKTLQTIAPDPVSQGDRVTVRGLVPGAIGSLNRVESSDQMPGQQAARRRGRQEMCGKSAGKIRGNSRSRLEERGQVPVHELRSVRFIHRPAQSFAVGVMKRYIEQTTGHQRPQPRHGFAAPFCIELVQQPGQHLLLKVVSDLHRMPVLGVFRPTLRQPDGELFEGVVTHFVGYAAGPDPLHAQRRLAPAHGLAPLSIDDLEDATRARDRGGCLCPEFQRHARPDGQEIQADANYSDISGLGHENRRMRIECKGTAADSR